jgi:hypothetical protein
MVGMFHVYKDNNESLQTYMAQILNPHLTHTCITERESIGFD